MAYITFRSKTDGAWLVHPDLRGKIVDDAREKGTNVSDIVSQIMAKDTGTPYTPVIRRSAADPDAGVFVVDFPDGLEDIIKQKYATIGWQNGIRLALSKHYGLGMPPKVKRARKRRSASAAA